MEVLRLGMNIIVHVVLWLYTLVHEIFFENTFGLKSRKKFTPALW